MGIEFSVGSSLFARAPAAGPGTHYGRTEGSALAVLARRENRGRPSASDAGRGSAAGRLVLLLPSADNVAAAATHADGPAVPFDFQDNNAAVSVAERRAAIGGHGSLKMHVSGQAAIISDKAVFYEQGTALEPRSDFTAIGVLIVGRDRNPPRICRQTP